MANNTSFVSPGVYTQEIDLSFVTASVGITTLAVVGETLKGPAFAPTLIGSQSNFLTRFGAQSTQKFSDGTPQYELPYIANEYLTQSNQLYVTRVLGLSGYDAGNAWIIKSSGGIDPTTLNISAVVTGTTSFTGNTGVFSDATLNALSLSSSFDNLPITAINSGVTFTVSTGTTLSKTGNNFSATKVALNVTSFSANTQGTATFTRTVYSASTLAAYDNLPLALLRSRATYNNTILEINTTGVTIDTGATKNALSPFTLTTQNDSYIVSLDQTNSHFISNVLGVGAQDKTTDIFVEDVYSNMVTNLVAQGLIYGIKSPLALNSTLNDYKSTYATPVTPFIVSELRGNKVQNLFQLVSISDGNAANQEIKISIENVNFDTREFDVMIRDFNDVDSNPIYLEGFRKCTMNPKLTSYIGNRIGTTDETYALQSNYVMVYIDPNAPFDGVAAGFQGYLIKNYGAGINTPLIQYKSIYNFSAEKVTKAYLGLSNIAGIDQDFFNFIGDNVSTGTTAGFHMDSGVTGNYVTGKWAFTSTAAVAGTDYANLNARKFVLAPAGGFDGWDVYRTTRTNTDDFRQGQANFSAFTTANPSDYYAYLQGIQTFQNASDVAINVLATPGIDYSNQNSLVSETIDIVETRGDTLYVVTTPDIIPDTTAAQDMVDILNGAGIDSNYVCTFAPWVLYNDTQNGSKIYLPPSFEVTRNFASTDNKYAPWYATAGYNRGALVATKARLKVNQDDSDTLYDGRINPIRSFPGSPLLIMGNKNLQVADSALNRINVRRLLLQVEKLVAVVGVRLLFEPDDSTLQTQFVNAVNPILENVKKQRGIIDYKVVCDGTNNTAQTADQLELVGNIYIKPTLSLEFLVLSYTVTDQGASFTIS